MKNKNLLTPKTDVVFHSLFRVGNERITKAMIEDITKRKIKQINLEEDRQLIKRYPEEKLGILDLKAVLDDGVLCNIEIQLFDKSNTVERILYYWSRMYSSQLIVGEGYEELKKTICIAILDYELKEIKEEKKYHTEWKIKEKGEKEKLTDKLEIHIIEIPKVMKEMKKIRGERVAQWMMFLSDPNNKEVEEIMKENEEIKEAMGRLKEISEDEELRRVAELRQKAILDEKAIRKRAIEIGLEEGREKGIEEGKREGRREGRREGIKEGRKNGINEVAKRMLKEKIDIKLIEKMTGLTRDEIEKL